MSELIVYQCPKAARHLVGIGDSVCDHCNRDIYTGRVPIPCPFKRPILVVRRRP